MVYFPLPYLRDYRRSSVYDCFVEALPSVPIVQYSPVTFVAGFFVAGYDADGCAACCGGYRACARLWLDCLDNE
ncbi:hypothetical protein THF1A12_330021 [Vibrio jasicida]|uniref:Uncharacterized protein n=1 Tax=Vibrio jasicida TaxID=766224 RepID=A0AAU9QPR7_9VIBR|nr:hypothetical protein THF1A12_330021 [Vibrio jasicida]